MKEGTKQMKEEDMKWETPHFYVPILDNPSKWQNMIHPLCDS